MMDISIKIILKKLSETTLRRTSNDVSTVPVSRNSVTFWNYRNIRCSLMLMGLMHKVQQGFLISQIPLVICVKELPLTHRRD